MSLGRDDYRHLAERIERDGRRLCADPPSQSEVATRGGARARLPGGDFLLDALVAPDALVESGPGRRPGLA
jgi:hypothetical protein